MNPETVTLIERSYQEIVDDILTAIVGGVVNEPIVFDLKETFYPLSQSASDVRGIQGFQQQHRVPAGGGSGCKGAALRPNRNLPCWSRRPSGGSCRNRGSELRCRSFRPRQAARQDR